jgi:hypothetical protein
MLTIFANINISSKEKFTNLKDSYESMSGISDDWLINIRGKYRKTAIRYLKLKLGRKGTFFKLLDDSRGWMKNSLDMVDKAKYKYLLIWNEDHINTAPEKLYSKIIIEMNQNGAEYMIYSWWFFGEIRKLFDNQKIIIGKYVDSILLTPEIWRNMKDGGYGHYIISMVGIFRKDRLKKFMISDSKKWPIVFSKLLFLLLALGKKINLGYNIHTVFGKTNRLLGNHLARYPKETPFELEKDPERIDILPIKISLPKRELFACINDDGGFEGYQLKTRRSYHKYNINYDTK